MRRSLTVATQSDASLFQLSPYHRRPTFGQTTCKTEKPKDAINTVIVYQCEPKVQRKDTNANV